MPTQRKQKEGQMDEQALASSNIFGASEKHRDPALQIFKRGDKNMIPTIAENIRVIYKEKILSKNLVTRDVFWQRIQLQVKISDSGVSRIDLLNSGIIRINSKVCLEFYSQKTYLRINNKQLSWSSFSACTPQATNQFNGEVLKDFASSNTSIKMC